MNSFLLMLTLAAGYTEEVPTNSNFTFSVKSAAFITRGEAIQSAIDRADIETMAILKTVDPIFQDDANTALPLVRKFIVEAETYRMKVKSFEKPYGEVFQGEVEAEIMPVQVRAWARAQKAMTRAMYLKRVTIVIAGFAFFIVAMTVTRKLDEICLGYRRNEILVGALISLLLIECGLISIY